MFKTIFLITLLLTIGFSVGYSMRSVQLLTPDSIVANSNVEKFKLITPKSYGQEYYFDNVAKFGFYFNSEWEISDQLHRPGVGGNTVELIVQGPYVFAGNDDLDRFSNRVIVEVSTYTDSKSAKEYLEALPDIADNKSDVVPVKLGKADGYKVDYVHKDPLDNTKGQHRIVIVAIKNNLLYRILYFGSSSSDLTLLQNNAEIEKQAQDLLSSFELLN